MTEKRTLVAAALLDPESVLSFEMTDWGIFVRQARAADLLGRIGATIEARNWAERIPERPRLHYRSDVLLARKQARDVRWEVKCIRETLGQIGVRTILLKGAAYVLADLPAAQGRMFSDVDVLVPKDRIEDTEQALFMKGWVVAKTTDYDDHYYRTWMHQLPPMRHVTRETYIDVHHTIVPETARVDLKSKDLLEAAVPVDGHDNLYVLAPTDMVIHSAVHLFNEGEFDHGLRDLSDMDLLLRHFSTDPAFWPSLVARAQALDLARPLYYALRYTSEILGTPVPRKILAGAARAEPQNLPRMKLMDALFRRALRPDHPSCDDRFTGLARWLLYVRAHHLRMPPHLLIPHLIRKAFTKER